MQAVLVLQITAAVVVVAVANANAMKSLARLPQGNPTIKGRRTGQRSLNTDINTQVLFKVDLCATYRQLKSQTTTFQGGFSPGH